MRAIEWTNSNGTVTRGIAFSCANAKCHNEVKVDEHHPEFAEIKENGEGRARCNRCSEPTVPPLKRIALPDFWPAK